MVKYALILAGGQGSRLKSSIAKQFIEIGNKPIIVHTIRKFQEAFSDINIVVVLPENASGVWEEIKVKHNLSQVQTAYGGKERFDSVKNGLEVVKSSGLVAIHDAVRPFLSKNLIRACFDQALEKGNAIPAVPLKDSLIQIEGDNMIQSLKRDSYRLIQTPQVFDLNLIKTLYNTFNFSDEITDDSCLLAKSGYPIHLVEGERQNIKITSPEDLLIAEMYVKKYL